MHNPDLALEFLIGLTVVFLAVSVGIILYLAKHVRTAFWPSAVSGSDSAWRSYLMQLPLAIPEGTIRALISLFVIVFGLLVLVMQDQLGMKNGDVIAGFVGIVITFYFTARSNDQAQRAVEAAKSAADSAQTAATSAQSAVGTARTAVGDVVNSVQVAATRLTDASNQMAAPAIAPAPAPAAGASDAQARLRDIRDGLQSIRSLATVVSGLGVGTEVLGDADGVMKTVDGLLGSVDPLLSGRPDAGSLQTVTKSAGDALETLQNAGLPGILGDAIATFKGTLDVASPILAGLAGGPVGLVGGLVMGGIALVRNQQQFGAWKTALLNRPFDPQLMSAMTVDGTTALEALELSPLMLARIGPGSPVATGLMRAALTRRDDGTPLPAAEIATQLWTDGQELGLKGKFSTAAELAQALEEYRSTLVFGEARKRLDGSVDVPAVGGQPAQSVSLSSLAVRSLQLRRDPRAASELERIVYLTEALGKLPLPIDKLVAMIGPALQLGLSLAASKRQDSEPRANQP